MHLNIVVIVMNFVTRVYAVPFELRFHSVCSYCEVGVLIGVNAVYKSP